MVQGEGYETRNLDLNFSSTANYPNLASHFLNLKDEGVKLGDSEDSSFSKTSDPVNNSCLRISIKFKSAPKSLQPSKAAAEARTSPGPSEHQAQAARCCVSDSK